MIKTRTSIKKQILTAAFEKLCMAKSMTELYEANFKIVSKYVHATSRGHEAIQVAAGMQLLPQDFAFPYYRDDAMLLGMGLRPFDLMLQLLAKKNDPFSGGRSYYSHPSLREPDKPKIPHQSSATGMQAIPATGLALGIQYKEQLGLKEEANEKPIVLCSMGDASVTEGEVAEAFQMATLRKLPILFLIQDNEWDISATADEFRSQNAAEYAKGFHGLESLSIDGTDFIESFNTLQKVIAIMREERKPFLVHARVPLLNHHTSGVRMEWYRDDLEKEKLRDPYPILKNQLLEKGFTPDEVEVIERRAFETVKNDFEKALLEEDPQPDSLYNHIFCIH